MRLKNFRYAIYARVSDYIIKLRLPITGLIMIIRLIYAGVCITRYITGPDN